MLPAGITHSTSPETILQHYWLAAGRLASSRRFFEFTGSGGRCRTMFLEWDGG